MCCRKNSEVTIASQVVEKKDVIEEYIDGIDGSVLELHAVWQGGGDGGNVATEEIEDFISFPLEVEKISSSAHFLWF